MQLEQKMILGAVSLEMINCCANEEWCEVIVGDIPSKLH